MRAQETVSFLLNYGELPDELAGGLEQHLTECEGCRAEFEAIRTFEGAVGVAARVRTFTKFSGAGENAAR